MSFFKSPFIELNNLGYFKRPFIKVNNDEDVTLLFMEAITKMSPDYAKRYISKNFVNFMDLNEIKDFFVKNNNFKLVKKIHFDGTPKNCKIKSMIFIDSDKKSSNIINVHMICEPDKYSKWKIYAFDEENEVL